MTKGAKARGEAKVHQVMHEYKMGALRSGGKKVTSRDQALAIALSSARNSSKRKK